MHTTTARQADTFVRPRIVRNRLTIAEATASQKYDRADCRECLDQASHDTRAAGLICTGCPDNASQPEVSEAAPNPGKTGMLFPLQPPYELRLVGIDEIDIDYEITPKVMGRLSGSIESLGILQTVLLQKTDTGPLKVVAGRRRVLSAKTKDLRVVPAMVFDEQVPEATIWIYAAAENMMRAPNPGLEAEALQHIMALNQWTVKEASAKLGFPLQVIKERLKLARLVPEMFHRLKQGTVTPSQAKRLASLPAETQEELAGMDTLTSGDIETAYKSHKLDSLIEQEDLFELPIAVKPNMRIVRDQIEGILASTYQVRGDENLLRKALEMIARYEESLEGDGHD